MCCLPTYPGQIQNDISLWQLDEAMTFLGVPKEDESNDLAEALRDLASVYEKLNEGVVILYNVKDIEALIRLEKEVGFWAKGLHEYDCLLEIGD